LRVAVRILHLRLLGPITGKGRLTWLLDITANSLIRDRKLLAELLWSHAAGIWRRGPHRATPDQVPSGGARGHSRVAWRPCRPCQERATNGFLTLSCRAQKLGKSIAGGGANGKKAPGPSLADALGLMIYDLSLSETKGIVPV